MRVVCSVVITIKKTYFIVIPIIQKRSTRFISQETLGNKGFQRSIAFSFIVICFFHSIISGIHLALT